MYATIKQFDIAGKELEAGIRQHINDFIKSTGCFPTVGVSVSADYKRYSVTVTNVSTIK